MDDPVITFTLPNLPKSMNQIYSIIPRWSEKRIQVQLKDDVLFWKTQAKEYIPYEELDQSKYLWLSLILHGNWHTKAGTVRVIDLQNLLKVIIDAVAEKLRFNDSRIFELRKLLKVQSDDERVDGELGYL